MHFFSLFSQISLKSPNLPKNLAKTRAKTPIPRAKRDKKSGTCAALPAIFYGLRPFLDAFFDELIDDGHERAAFGFEDMQEVGIGMDFSERFYDAIGDRGKGCDACFSPALANPCF